MPKKLLFIALAIMAATNASAQWKKLTTAPVNSDLEMTDVFAYNGKIIATGYTFSNFQGRLLVSDDNGESWTTKLMDPGKLLKTIGFKDADTGYIAGYGSVTVMYKTTDGGNTWNTDMVDFNNAGINDMQFLSNRVGVAAGYSHDQFFSGQCYKTYDGGLTWDTIAAQNRGCLDTVAIDFIQFVDAKVGYGRSDLFGGKTMTKTIDSGKTFFLLYEHATAIAGIHFWNVDNGILVDSDGDIYRTTNGGQNWTKQSSSIQGAGILTAMAFLNQTTGFAGSGSGKIFKTTDGGQSWTAQTSVVGTYISRIRFSQNRAYLVARGGHVARSEELPNTVDDVLMLDEQLNIYPNPANDVLNVSSYQGRYQHIAATIADMAGKTVVHATTNNGLLQIATANIAAGNYILSVNADGKTTSVKISVTH